MKRKIDELKQDSEDLLIENLVLRVEKQDLIRDSNARIGDKQQQLTRFLKGLFPDTRSQLQVGYGAMLNGQQVYYRKASQALWDP